eukprot:5253036-Pleurochrysis_carterae.AAC.4
MVACEDTCFACIAVVDSCFSIFLRVLGPILIVAANSLIGFVVYEYLAVLTPRQAAKLCIPLQCLSITANTHGADDRVRPQCGCSGLPQHAPKTGDGMLEISHN